MMTVTNILSCGRVSRPRMMQFANVHYACMALSSSHAFGNLGLLNVR